MTTAISPLRPAADPAVAPPVIDIVIPVYNEEQALTASVGRLREYLIAEMPHSWRITIADNASTDATWAIAETLAWRHPDVRAVHLDRKGRGRALNTVWSASDASVLCYMDVDLSTGLDALLPLVAPLLSGHSDMAIGSRLARGAAVARGPRREFISRTYNMILRTVFGVRFRDAQCGFKAIRADVARRLLPAVEDTAWFFDTELLLLAEHNGLRVHEVPVDWVDDPDSRVHVRSTAIDDLKGVWRMVRRFASGRGRLALDGIERRPLADDMGRRLVSFASIGAVSTLLSVALFLMLRGGFGPLRADAIAMAATAAGNTWANRRFTYGLRTRAPRLHTVSVVAVLLATLLASAGALGVVTAAGGGAIAEVAALLVTWGLGSIARFALLRRRTGTVGR